MDQETRQRIDTLLDDPSIYPDRTLKSREQREADLLAWLNTYGEVLAGYNLYGLDLVDAPDCNEYLDGGVSANSAMKLIQPTYRAGVRLHGTLRPSHATKCSLRLLPI